MIWTILTVLGIVVGAILLYSAVSFMVKGYIERGYRNKGSSKTWDEDGADVFKVLAWPVALLVVLPAAVGESLGGKVWARVHRAELIEKELKNEQHHGAYNYAN